MYCGQDTTVCLITCSELSTVPVSLLCELLEENIVTCLDTDGYVYLKLGKLFTLCFLHILLLSHHVLVKNI